MLFSSVKGGAYVESAVIIFCYFDTEIMKVRLQLEFAMVFCSYFFLHFFMYTLNV